MFGNTLIFCYVSVEVRPHLVFVPWSHVFINDFCLFIRGCVAKAFKCLPFFEHVFAKPVLKMTSCATLQTILISFLMSRHFSSHFYCPSTFINCLFINVLSYLSLLFFKLFKIKLVDKLIQTSHEHFFPFWTRLHFLWILFCFHLFFVDL